MVNIHETTSDLEDKDKCDAFKRRINKSVSDMFREVRNKVQKKKTN